jgi:hypothetical protein
MITSRAYLPHALFIIGLALFASAPAVFLHTPGARAASFTPPAGYLSLQGNAWAGFLVPGSTTYTSGPGWISFSGTATNGDTYGVYEGGAASSAPGALAGYAWSSNYGWISFDPSTADGSHPAPNVNLSTGAVTGWARACAAFQSGCSGALNAGTGSPGNEWDGWISLSGTAADSSPYGITQGPNCGAWSGQAWGSADIGWISASGVADDSSSYGVTCAAPPTPISASCTVSPDVGNTITPFVWKVSSPTGGFGAPYTYAWTFDGVLSGNTGTSVTKTYSTTGAKTGSVTVTDAGGSSQSFSCTNSVGSPGVTVYATPTAMLTADKYTIVNGQSVTLTWSSTNATSGCTGNGFNTGGATSGNISVNPVVNPTNYGVTCSNPGGSASDSVAITVKNPTVSIGAKPARVSSGSHTKIFWTSVDTISCIVTGNSLSFNGLTSPDNGNPNSGVDSGAITQQTIFKINCTTNGNPASAQVVVNILPVFQEF